VEAGEVAKSEAFYRAHGPLILTRWSAHRKFVARGHSLKPKAFAA
jgi:hypothetical protein